MARRTWRVAHPSYKCKHRCYFAEQRASSGLFGRVGYTNRRTQGMSDPSPRIGRPLGDGTIATVADPAKRQSVCHPPEPGWSCVHVSSHPHLLRALAGYGNTRTWRVGTLGGHEGGRQGIRGSGPLLPNCLGFCVADGSLAGSAASGSPCVISRSLFSSHTRRRALTRQCTCCTRDRGSRYKHWGAAADAVLRTASCANANQDVRLSVLRDVSVS